MKRWMHYGKTWQVAKAYWNKVFDSLTCIPYRDLSQQLISPRMNWEADATPIDILRWTSLFMCSRTMALSKWKWQRKMARFPNHRTISYSFWKIGLINQDNSGYLSCNYPMSCDCLVILWGHGEFDIWKDDESSQLISLIRPEAYQQVGIGYIIRLLLQVSLDRSVGNIVSRDLQDGIESCLSVLDEATWKNEVRWEYNDRSRENLYGWISSYNWQLTCAHDSHPSHFNVDWSMLWSQPMLVQSIFDVSSAWQLSCMQIDIYFHHHLLKKYPMVLAVTAQDHHTIQHQQDFQEQRATCRSPPWIQI